VSWEAFDAWPGEASQGPFRGAHEPVVATRVGLTARERSAAYWASSPDRPLARLATRVVLTNAYIYLERRDGSRGRVAREQIVGVRREGPFLVFGVAQAEDLLLPARAGCPVQAALFAGLPRVQGEGPGELRSSSGVYTGAAFGVAGLLAIPFLLHDHPAASALAHLRAGLYTSETVLFVAGALLAFLLALFFLLWAPMRARIDPTGIEIARGVVPWLVFRREPEAFAWVDMRLLLAEGRGRQRTLVPVPYGYVIEARLRSRQRFATLSRTLHVPVAWRTGRVDPSVLRKEGAAFAQQARALLGLG
jgi:hypothetical protein